MANNPESFKLDLMEPLLVESYYEQLRSIFVHDLEQPDGRGLILDLSALPTKPVDFKEAVIKWLISVNLTRIKRGEDPLITLEVVSRCPVWRVIRMPLKRISLTKEKLFNKPSATGKTINSKSKMGSINKG